ncbi:MAG TPA: LysR substrate-binding domain-containing protein [Jatrophihabitans sp.]|jgi:DNA-binding transcriptional LysR family regulator
MLNPAQLMTLRSVLASGSFAATAIELSYTPSAVSQQISALERATGLVLFERDSHSVRPTEHARQLAERAAGLLDVIDSLDRDVAALARGEAGRLRIGSFPTASARLLPPALAALTKAHPGIEIEVDEGELDTVLPRLRAGELDVAIAYRYDTVAPSWPATLIATPLLTERLWLLVPEDHPRAGDAAIRLGSLERQRWVAPLAGSPGAINLDRLTAAAGFAPRVSFRSNDYGVVRGLVAAGLGVAVVPGLALSPTPGVVAIAISGRTARRRVLALHRPSNQNALIAAMLSAVADPARRISSAP